MDENAGALRNFILTWKCATTPGEIVGYAAAPCIEKTIKPKALDWTQWQKARIGGAS